MPVARAQRAAIRSPGQFPFGDSAGQPSRGESPSGSQLLSASPCGNVAIAVCGFDRKNQPIRLPFGDYRSAVGRVPSSPGRPTGAAAKVEREPTMMNWGANLFRTMLLAATLAAVAPPALAADIQTGDVCQKKIVPLSWHVCGAVPADGQISYVNVGIHELTVFTTGPEGITSPSAPRESTDADHQIQIGVRYPANWAAEATADL